MSPDGRSLYVAENLSDSLAVVDLATRRVVQRLGAGRFPYAVAVTRDNHVFVTAWGGSTVTAFAPDVGGRLTRDGVIEVGRHPSALVLNPSGTRAFVTSASTDRIAVVDTRTRQVTGWLLDPPPDGVTEGSTPNALALSPCSTCRRRRPASPRHKARIGSVVACPRSGTRLPLCLAATRCGS